MGNELDKGDAKPKAGRSRHRNNAVRQDSQKNALPPGTLPGQRKKKGKRRGRVIAMIIAECFALLFICGYGFVARRWNMIQRMDDWVPEEVENPNFSVDLPQYQKQKGHWGIYIFGVDSRGSNVGKETNADVNMICDINHDTGEVRLVSVFRDSYLNINDDGGYNKINQAYFMGGPSTAAKMLNKNLDLNIGDFVTFNWKAVADGINILGGVDMEISKAEFYYINSFITETVEATGVYSTHLKQAGMNHLDGVQAVAYGRLRLMDTDFARTERQRKVIKAAFEKAKQADFATLNQLTLTLFPQVATSVDMQDIINLLGDVGKYYIGETGGFPFARGDANMGRKGACVIPQTLESNVKELHQFLYGEESYVVSDTVKQISAKISSDSGMYSQGVSIDHVSTSGGAIPSATKAARAAEPAKESRKAEEEEEPDETVLSASDEEPDGSEGREESPSSDSQRDPTKTAPTLPGESRPGNRPTSPAERTDNVAVDEPTAQSRENPEESSQGPSPRHPTEVSRHPEETSATEPRNPEYPGSRQTDPAQELPTSPPASRVPETPASSSAYGPGNEPGPSPVSPVPDTSAADRGNEGEGPGGAPLPSGGITTIPAGPGIS